MERHHDPGKRDARLRAVFLAVFLVGILVIGAAWVASGEILR